MVSALYEEQSFSQLDWESYFWVFCNDLGEEMNFPLLSTINSLKN